MKTTTRAMKTLTILLLLGTLAQARAQDLILDNSSSQFSTIGTWPVSTAVAGYEGANYQTHAANGPAPGATVVDNTDAGFSVTGTWPLSTSVTGYQGSNYQVHAANGAEPDAIVVDNTDAGFSTIGTWPVSTSVTGYQGSNYQTHAANGAEPDAIVLDNTQGTATGTWSTSTSVTGYYGSNYLAHAAGTGANSFIWSTAASGTYNVYARWTQHPNRASNATYTITDNSGSHSITVDQQTNGSSWQLLGTYSFDTTASITLTDNANGYVIADAIKLVPPNAPPNTAIWTAAIATPGTYNIYARWTAHPNRASNATYTVIDTTGSHSVSVDQQQNGGGWNLLGSYNLGTNSQISLTDQANGYVIADAIKIVPQNAAPNTATWALGITTPGTYNVYARWTAHPNRASNATYTVIDTTGSNSVSVDQQQNGGSWNLLGSYNLNSNSRVSLTDQANGYVIADAIQLIPANQSLHNTATWTPNVNGSYQIYAKWTQHPNRASNATYTITDSTGSHPITVNQQQNGATWNLLGTFNLNPTSTIQLSDQANGYVIADALRLTSINQEPVTYYIHTDHLDTPREITDTQGNTVWAWDNADPFGNNPPDENPGGAGQFSFPLRFPGQYADQETNTYYNYFRDCYDPATGRYCQSDPIGLAGGINTYTYVNGNPISYIDPEGLDAYGFGDLNPPSFFDLTTIAAARRDTSLEQAVNQGELTRTVTLPAVGASLLPEAIGLAGSTAEVGVAACRAVPEALPKVAEACKNPALAFVLGASICGNVAGTVQGSARGYVRNREQIEAIAEASKRALRRNTGGVRKP